MTRTPKSTPNRRTLLSALGTGLATSLVGIGATAAQQEPRYVLVQDGECVPVRPITGDVPVDAFYEYQLPEQYVTDENGAVAGTTTSYASAGTRDLQRAQTSIAFLYRGPDGLSLVVVHGSVENDDAGSVTFELAGLPEDGEWAVKDDLYRDPDTGEPASTNYDRWDVAGTDHRVDWTWGSSGTDGGAFRGLGDAVDVTVRPAFNEAAALHDEHYEGTVTDWEFLSGGESDVERISLALDQPIRLAAGGCGDVSSPTETARQTEQPATEGETERDTETATETETESETETETETTTETETETERDVEQEQNVDVEQDQEIEGGEDVETEQSQEVHTEQEQRTGPREEDEEDDERRVWDDDDEDEGREDWDEDDDDEDEDEGRGDWDDDEEDERDDEARRGLGLGRGNGDEGHGKGHEKGRGRGHERGRGEGHDRHDDD